MASMPPPQGDLPRSPKRKPYVVWLAVAVCLGGCICPLVVGALLFPVFARARDSASSNICFARLATIGSAIRRYQRKHGVFPKSIEEAVTDAGLADSYNLHCPKAHEPGPGMGYAYNAAMFAGRSPDQLPLDVVEQPLVIEVSDVKPNASITPATTFGKRHGHWVNADFYGRGPVRLELSDQQLSSPVMSIKNLVSYEKEPTSLYN